MPILNDDEYFAKERQVGHFGMATFINADMINWHAIGEKDPRTRLLAQVLVGSVAHHLEARQVHEVDDGVRSIDYDEDMEALEGISGSPFKGFVEIEGRHYFLFMTPHS